MGSRAKDGEKIALESAELREYGRKKMNITREEIEKREVVEGERARGSEEESKKGNSLGAREKGSAQKETSTGSRKGLSGWEQPEAVNATAQDIMPAKNVKRLRELLTQGT